MSDNTVIALQTGGDVIAGEDHNGVKYQRVKIVDGTPGSINPLKVEPDGSLRVSPNGETNERLDTLVEGINSLRETLDDATGAAIGIKPGERGRQREDRSLSVALADEQAVNTYIQCPTIQGGVGTETMDIFTAKPNGKGIDVSRYRSMSIQVTTNSLVAQGQIVFEGTNDLSVNYAEIPMTLVSVGDDTPTYTSRFNLDADMNLMFVGPTTYKHVRARLITPFMAGRLRTTLCLSPTPWSPFTVQAVQNLGALLNVAIQGSGKLSAKLGGEGITVVPTQDQSTAGGLNTVELLALVLAELRVHSHYLFNLSANLNSGTVELDQPDNVRNDFLGTVN